MEDSTVNQVGDGGEPAESGTPAPSPAAGTGDQSAGVEIPRFFSTPAPAVKTDLSPDLEGIDPSKLSPENQQIYKQIQAGYTKKFQAVADMRRELETERRNQLDEREKWLEKIAGQVRPGEPQQPSDPLAKVQELRDQGLHAEADKLLYQLSNEKASERVGELEREARISNMKSNFRDVVADAMTLPVVGKYKEAVQQVFDGNHPDIRAFRELIFRNPQYMPLIKPLLHLIATERHAANLEANYEKAVAEGIKAGIAKEVALATKSPTKLVPGSQVGRNISGTPREPDIKKALAAAKASLFTS